MYLYSIYPDYNGIREGHIYCPFQVLDLCKSCQKKKCQPGKLRELLWWIRRLRSLIHPAKLR